MYQPRRTPVHRSLMEMKTIAGVERRIAIANITIAAALTMAMHMWAYVAAAAMLHVVLAYMTKREPFLRLFYIRYNRQHDMYDPWPHAVQRSGHRPHGFGRGTLC
jgi:type IV secretory pathway TrbD component